jgi:sugar lactone lactonase YvrE
MAVATNVMAVAAGEYHSLFVKSGGTSWAMGYNNYGQLGNGTTANTNKPVNITSNVVAVAGGRSHSLFVKSDGTSWAMGYNNYGQLGNGTTVSTNIPIQIAGLTIASLGACSMAYHSLAIGAFSPQISSLSNQIVNLGQTATFSVTITNGDGPFTYQWQLDGTNLPDGIITTVVGNNVPGGSPGYAGDGGAATNATLARPGFVTVDSLGDLFFADQTNTRIRKVSYNGIVTTVAGNGKYTGAGSVLVNNPGDGGPATNATLGWLASGTGLPISPVVDNIGNLFIADSANNRIRKVDTNGIITSVAGSGPAGLNMGSYSGDGGQATTATLNYPSGAAVDDFGNLFIADNYNHRIRQITPDGVITTIAGTGAANFSGDGGAATSAGLNYPNAIAVDKIGNVFIADGNNYRIRKIDTNGIITTVAGSGPTGFGNGSYSGDGGPATNARLNTPTGVAVDANGNLFILDSVNFRIRKVDTSGIITTVAGNGIRNDSDFSGDGGAATNAALHPAGLAADTSGNLFITHVLYGDGNGRIRKVVTTKGPTLKISNSTIKNGGNYSVIVGNSAGAVTSSIVSLTVLLPPQGFNGQAVTNAGLQLQFTGTPNYPYILQMTTNLTPPVNWQSILTNPADGNGNWSFTVTNLTDLPAGYYRAVGQ